jgi:hypothetical protein
MFTDLSTREVDNNIIEFKLLTFWISVEFIVSIIMLCVGISTNSKHDMENQCAETNFYDFSLAFLIINLVFSMIGLMFYFCCYLLMFKFFVEHKMRSLCYKFVEIIISMTFLGWLTYYLFLTCNVNFNNNILYQYFILFYVLNIIGMLINLKRFIALIVIKFFPNFYVTCCDNIRQEELLIV